MVVNTSLASQLRQLAAPQTSLLVHKKKRPSFLFNEKEAANLDREAVYQLGLSGLDELKKLNPDFIKFEKTLFDESAKSFERCVESSEINDKLNKNIREMCILLSPYFLLKPCHKVIEWLVNRYHVQEFNTDDLLFLGLPYHETMTFARLLQLLPVEEDRGKWNWLALSKKSGTPLSKTSLLNRAATDTEFYKFVCNMPLEAVKVSKERSSKLNTLFSFYCSTILGGLEKCRVINDLHISLVLGSIMKGLSSQFVDFTSASYIILARLSTKTKLSDKLVDTLYNKLSKVKSEKLKKETALVFIVLNQSSACALSREAMLRLSHHSHIIESVSYWSSRSLVTLPFVVNMVRVCLQGVQDKHLDEESRQRLKHYVKSLLNLNFDDTEAGSIFKVFIWEWQGLDEDWYKECLSSIQTVNPQGFDSATSELLKDSKVAVVLRHLLGLTSSRCQVFDNLVHPKPHLRVEAIKHITDNYNQNDVGWLCDTVLARLEDDSPEVIGAALQCEPALNSADKTTLSAILQRTLIKAWIDDSVNLSKALQRYLEYCTDSSYLVDFILFPIIVTKSHLISKSKLDKNKSKLIQFAKNNLTEEAVSQKKLLRPLLNQLPKLTHVKDHLEQLCQQHSVYRFLSLLLLARHPSDFDSKIFSNYISSNMDISYELEDLENFDSLRRCLSLCKQNKLPLEAVLNFISRSCFLDQSDASDSLVPDVTSLVYKPLLNIITILFHGANNKDKKVANIFRKSANLFLEENFPENEKRAYFLLSCALYGWEHDSALLLPSVNTLYRLIPTLTQSCQSSKSNLINTLLSLDSPAVPMLAALLHYSDISVRSKVLKIFVKLVEVFSPIPGYRGFVEQIIPCAEELKLDPEQIIVLCYTQLSPNKEIRSLLPTDIRQSMKNSLNSMTCLLANLSTPTYVSVRILQILECVNSTSLLQSLLPLLNKFIGKDLSLDPVQSLLVKLILKKFDDQQSEGFSQEYMWHVLDQVLSDTRTVLLDSPSDSTVPAAYLIHLLPKLLYDSLPEPRRANQEKLLELIINKTYDCDNIKVSHSVSGFFKRLSIDGEIISNLLKWFSIPQSPTKSTVRKIRRSLSNIPSLELLESENWKKGVFLLEQIQNKSKLNDLTILIPCLFDILNKCLLFEVQSPVEYTKQLILSVLLECCQSIGSSPVSPELIQVDVIVGCLRISHNPQTHHHALLALTHIANILPDNVLHSIMEIFTFIGTSIARQDDAYSFQIITKLIETIIPILVQGKDEEVVGVVRVFVSAMLDIPEHRRQVLLLKLLTTLSPEKHLWILLSLVFESNVLRPPTTQVKGGVEESSGKTKKLEIASQLCCEFSVDILLSTASHLLRLAIALPHDKGPDDEVEVAKEVSSIFNVKSNSGKQLRHFKYTLLGFLSQLLSSNAFIHQIALMSPDESRGLEDSLRNVMQLCLTYVKDLTKHYELFQQASNQAATKYWKVIINLAYEILDKVVGMLPLESFVSVVATLLKDTKCCTRKVLELITWRLSQGLTSDETELVYPLLAPVSSISLSHDEPVTKQTALITMKLLTRHLASQHVKKFVQYLDKLVGVLCSKDLVQWEVIASLVLCLAEIVTCLGAHSISQLNKYMPALLHILQYNATSELLVLSCVTCLHKIVDNLHTFLSPYMQNIIYRVCYLSATLQSTDKSAPILAKLKLIRNKISSSVESRILVPCLAECYSKIIMAEEFSLVSPLMSLLSDSFNTGVRCTPELSSLVLRGLAFRSECADSDTVEAVEPHVLSALMCLVLKLSESAFRPLYHKIYDWAIRGSKDPRRAITFYRLSSGLAEKLRGLFVLFSGLFIQNSCSLLDQYNTSKNQTLPCSVPDSVVLVESIVKTLLSVFTYDTHNFLTKERFSLLMQPLVDQMENDLDGVEAMLKRNHDMLIPCIAGMAAATQDDSLWKQLNYQVLLKMRHHNSQVRLCALETVHEIAKKLGEDFLPLLPETVPFLAELLEDTDESIEKQTHQTIASMEAVLGEPIQKYF